jgi:hypothetical protein
MRFYRFLFAVTLFAVALTTTGCFTDKTTATRVLQDSGYKNIQITGYRYFACSKDDDYSTGFRATAPSGATVTGAVCAEFFSGSHIRLK